MKASQAEFTMWDTYFQMHRVDFFQVFFFHPETFRAQRVAWKADKTLTLLACFSTKLTFWAMKLWVLLKNTLKLSKFCQFFKRRVELEMFRDEKNTWKKVHCEWVRIFITVVLTYHIIKPLATSRVDFS